MKKIIAFIKKYWIAFVGITSAVVGVTIFLITRRAPKPTIVPVLKERIAAQKELTRVQVEAATVIAEARGEEHAIVKEIESIAARQDSVKTSEEQKQQLQRLADLANRT